MNIEILQPELQALINERMSTGQFRTVEDMLRQALEDSQALSELAPTVDKPNFAEFLKNSPLWGSGLTVTRSNDSARPVILQTSMPRYLVDTNPISEFSRPLPDESVMRWFGASDPLSLHASVITLAELRLGIEDLPAGKRRNDLEDWLAVGLPNQFAGNLLPITGNIVELWAKLTVAAKRRGKTVSMPDGLIAATALQYGLTLVTRNTSDFEDLGIALLNPWTLLHQRPHPFAILRLVFASTSPRKRVQ